MRRNQLAWCDILVRDCCESIQYGYTAKSNPDTVGPKLLRITDIVQEIIDWNSVPHCEIDSTNKKKYRLEDGDIVVARTGATCGYAKLIKNPPESVFASYLVRLKPNKNVDACFLGYVINSDDYKRFVMSSNTGAAQPNASAQVLTSYPIKLPPLPTQIKISSVLSTYDDLIENNTRRIKILEEMAQSIYREWFVNFRFPGHEKVKMVESQLGLIPEGWEIKKLKSILNRLKPEKHYTEKEISPVGEIPVIDQSRNEVLGYHNNHPDFQASADNPLFIFGDHTCKMEVMFEPFSIGPNVVPFGTDNMYGLYWFFAIRNLVDTREYKRHWNVLVSKDVLLPTLEVVSSFEVTRNFIGLVKQLAKINRTLKQTRDLLLPRLISGEIDVSDLDIQIPEV